MKDALIQNRMFGAIVSLFLLTQAGIAQQDASMLFQSGIYAEEVQGDLEKAIEIYQRIADEFPDDRPLAARALLRMAFCFEKLGQPKAEDIFRRILDEYPDQEEIVAIARTRIKTEETAGVNPLLKHYFERICLDPMTSVSFDGKFLACTDWVDGNIIIRNLRTGEERKLTSVDMENTKSYAYHCAWSRDGKYVAYSFYRDLRFIELHVIHVKTKEHTVVFSAQGYIVLPQDWSPDSKKVLCEVFHYPPGKDLNHFLAFVSMNGQQEKITPLASGSRGMKLSPDGKLVTYDLRQDQNRHIFIYNIAKNKQTQISYGRSADYGYDSPTWSSDGKFLLYRSNMRGRYDLWAVPFQGETPAGESIIVHSDIMSEFLKMKGINEINLTKPNFQEYQNRQIQESKVQATDFSEEFDTGELSDAWSVVDWTGPNVYGNRSFGRYSLKDKPGFLRYYLDPMIVPGYGDSYMPGFNQWWYWYYPALELNRYLAGDRWVVEMKIKFSLVYGANSRGIRFIIFLNPEKEMDSKIGFSRETTAASSKIFMNLTVGYDVVAKHFLDIPYSEEADNTDTTYRFRISRVDTLIRLDIADNDEPYRSVLSGMIPVEFTGGIQKLMITGNCWFVPAGSYAEIDYIRFRRLD